MMFGKVSVFGKTSSKQGPSLGARRGLETF